MASKTHTAHRTTKHPESPLREAVEAKVFENLPGEPKLEPMTTPIKPSRADLEAALAEIEIVIGDKFAISRTIQDIIKRAKSAS
jgi:hypothetical protein